MPLWSARVTRRTAIDGVLVWAICAAVLQSVGNPGIIPTFSQRSDSVEDEGVERCRRYAEGWGSGGRKWAACCASNASLIQAPVSG